MISRESLEERVRAEVAGLGADALSWWAEHRVEPFVVDREGDACYAVARTDDGPPLIFLEDLDSFGQDAARPFSYSFARFNDLAAAIGCLAAREALSRLLRETAAGLLRLGVLDRGDDGSGTLWRALEVLAALGPAAAAAVPGLMAIMSNDELLGGLQERAIATLAAIGPAAAPAVPKLIEMATHDTANCRFMCLAAFDTIGAAALPATPFLIDLLLGRVSVDPDSFYVSQAATALGNIGAIAALPALLEVLQTTDDTGDATAVVEAIGKLGPAAAAAIPALTDRAHHPDADLRQVTQEALTRLTRSSTRIGGGSSGTSV